ncbi:ATP-dependent nuclease [Leuconostoc pseudomesenteroides]|uniref:ATP-dependent nuclease n=1 Tax=Leuconostoc pseudomesenteroides TaxID=33968 RepID=UPI00301BA00F
MDQQVENVETKFKFGINKVTIKNYRGIKNCSVNFKQNTIIVGRNNVGKSTIVSAIFGLGKIQNPDKLKISDLNIELIQKIFKNRKNISILQENLSKWTMQIEIEYIWSNVPAYLFEMITSLSTAGKVKVRVLAILNEDKFIDLGKQTDASKLNTFFNLNYEIFDYSIGEWIPSDNRNRYLLFPTDRNLIETSQNVYYIKADRRVDDGDSSNNNLTGQLFNNRLMDSVSEPEFTDTFKNIGDELKSKLSDGLNDMKDDLHRFSFSNNEIDNLEIIPTFDEWATNPKVRVAQLYQNLGIEIPINKQGLGYQNIYNILGQLGNAFKKISDLSSASIDKRLSVLFVIEEPEVYTHPQMQHVFVQQLVEYVNSKNTENLYIQTLIISHSAEIAVAAIEKDNDYRLIRVSTNQFGDTVAVDWDSNNLGSSRLSSLILNYNAELLFAQKAILVEGDSERAIITSIMRRLDNDVTIGTELLKQQIAIIPVGKSIANLEDSLQQLKFKKIVMFTDLDFRDKEKSKSYKYENTESSSNSLIRDMFLKENSNNEYKFQEKFNKFNSYSTYFPAKRVKNMKVYTQNWIFHEQFNCRFLPMTLEPSFLNSGNNFKYLKEYFTNTAMENDNKVNLKSGSKVNFAFDVALMLDEKDSTGEYKITIPKYLMEGLRWLSK